VSAARRQPDHKIYPYLLRQLAIARANQVWALATTYIPMARGFVDLTAVVEVASRLVLAQKVAITGGVAGQRDYRAGLCALWRAHDRQHRSG
jgi:transposase InsO family protein